jgi:sugar lactone lactonase YvrE
VTDAAPDVAVVARPVASLRHGAAAAPALLGEGPVWDAARGELVWVDIDRGLVHRCSPGGAETSVDVGQPVGCAVPRAGGGLALALRDGFALLPAAGDGEPRLVAAVEQGRADTRMNDGACDSRGRFWAGTMSVAGDTRTAGLYRLAPDLTITRVLPGLSISNGLGWSPDDRLMYHVDTPRRRIDIYEFDAAAGAIGGRRAAIPIAPEHGRPDGLSVDAEGGIWVALWGGGAVQRFTPEGELDARVELPATQVTSCCFGDPDLGTLFVTSAARRAEHEPLAGSLFACRPGVRGLPSVPFGG